MRNRKLFFFERIIYGDGTAPFNTIFPMKINGHIDTIDVNTALMVLQHKYELLRSTVRLDPTSVPFISVEDHYKKIPIRMVDRQHDDQWMEENTAEWETSFDMAVNPCMRVVWLKGAGVSEILLVFHHCFCDGASGIALMQDFLSFLDNPDQEISPVPLVHSMEEFIPKEIRDSQRIKNRVKLTNMLFKGLMLVSNTFRRQRKKCSQYYLHHWKLSKENTRLLLDKCKEEGVTVHAALCTAFLLSIKTLNRKSFLTKMSCPVDIRRYVPEMDAKSLWGFDLFVDLNLPSKKVVPFWHEVKLLNADLKTKLNKLDGYQAILFWESFNNSYELVMKFMSNRAVDKSVLFSNLGLLTIPSSYNKFEIETIYSPSSKGAFGESTALFTSTYKEQLDICFLSFENMLNKEDMALVKEQALTLIGLTESVKKNAFQLDK